MAVQHGYGKVAGADALVFAYDTGDTRNSYKGEPTSNIIADPLYRLGVKNAQYDNNNTGWGTVTRGKIEEVIGPFGKPVQAYSQELISYNSANRSTEGQPQDVVDNANCLVNLTSGITYRISVWIKATYTGTSQNRLYISGTAAVGDSVNRQITTEWQRFSRTYTPSTTGNYYMRHYDYSTKNTGDKIWYAHPQVEVDKGHDTQFIEGTRSATQGLLDLKGNSSIDLSNVSFDSNAQMTWDGTDDYVQGAASINYPTAWTDAYTLECMMYVPASATWFTTYVSSLIMKGSYAGSHGLVRSNVENTLAMWVRGDNGAIAASTTVSRDTWTHIVGVWTGEQVQIYKNGTLADTAGSARTGIPDGGGWRIGQASAASGDVGNTYEGYLPVVKFYNRALTAAEVANNYNHYKGRFNI
jgi:hypothetical protein